jgi:hypothetical protein
MTRYAAKTDVSSTRSRDEIERTLTRYGADQFMYGWQDSSAVVAFRMEERRIKFILPLPDRNAKEFTHHSQGMRQPDAAAKLWEQAQRQRWRALALVIKAKLEAVESGISEFDDEFMANIMLPNGGTVSDWMRPKIEQAYLSNQMPQDLPLLAAPVD